MRWFDSPRFLEWLIIWNGGSILQAKGKKWRTTAKTYRYSSLPCHGIYSYLFFFLSADQERWIVFCFLCRQEMQMKSYVCSTSRSCICCILFRLEIWCWSNACCIVPLWIKGLHVCCREAAGETGFCRTACRLRKQVSLSLFALSMFFIKRSLSLSAEPNKASSFLICQVHGSYSFLSSSQFLFFAEFPHRIEVFEHSLSEKYLINMHIHMHGNFRIQCVYGTILWLLFYDPAKAGSYRLVQMFITIV